MDKSGFPVIPSNRIDDLCNLDIAGSADLVLFMAGNQFMAMKEIVSEFKKECPEVKKIFYETLPPGMELKQILAKGAIFKGTFLDFYPDIYTAVSEKSMNTLEDTGHIYRGDFKLYLHNRLILLVPEGNPANIRTVEDLGRDDVRISQPDPVNEDIAFYIRDMYRQAGGNDLVTRIMEEKRAEGTAIFTLVHHRETPLRLFKKTVDVGPVWATEAFSAKASGMNFEVIEPGENLDQRNKINYYACRLENAPNPENGQKFFDFLFSDTCCAIYKKYGFVTIL
ncbi:substrate-binding domain-containing protein [Desulfobacterales bacterium HSG16]|nr:substrate-binding domain-containing protein [Desulfobacterales bacterium HSG16]